MIRSLAFMDNLLAIQIISQSVNFSLNFNINDKIYFLPVFIVLFGRGFSERFVLAALSKSHLSGQSGPEAK